MRRKYERLHYYADEYRRYQTYVREHTGSNASDHKVSAAVRMLDDYEWTRDGAARPAFNPAARRSQHGMMDGLSLHYYRAAQTDGNT